MAKGWTAAAVAVTLLACLVGIQAQWIPPVIRPVIPPGTKPANPPPSKTGTQWSGSGTKPANPPYPPTGSQGSGSGTKPANPPYPPTGSQGSGSGTKPANPPYPPTGSQGSGSGTKPANPPYPPTGSQGSGSGTKPANPPYPPTGSQGSGSGTKPANPPYPPTGSQGSGSGTKPANPVQPQQGQKNPVDPPTLKCEVPTRLRVPCGTADITAAECQFISCCFDGHSCYFAKAVTVQCTKDGQFIVVVSKDSTRPRLYLQSFSLLEAGQGCTYADSNSQFAIYQFPVTKCGSQVMEDSAAIVYENRLFSSYEVGVGPYGSITRDSQFELLFQCRYTASAVEPVVVEVVKLDNPIPPVADVGPLNVQLRLAKGKCKSKGCAEEDAAYTSYYTEYPVAKVLRDPVFVEVQLMDKTDPSLVLRLGRCWVTTSPNPHTLPQWDILIDGCPYRDDRYQSAIVPVKPSSGLVFLSHYRRFFFKMFTFVDPTTLAPLSEQIYIHCSTDVCDARPGNNCEPLCFRKRRDVDAVTESAEPKSVGSVGPILISHPDQ